jgi:hypothetical protein
MGPITPGEQRRSVIYTAQVLEKKFLLAQLTGDHEGMVEAAEDYHKLLGSYPSQGSGDPMPGRGSMERHRQTLLETREEILRNAPNLARIVRHLGPLDLHRVRQHVPPPPRARTRTRR